MRGRLFVLTLLGASCIAPCFSAPCFAADLDHEYEHPHHRHRVVEREVIVEHRVVIDHVVEAVPVPVGGPYLVVPGLNGPYGPPIYPLLPFSFGYGY